MRFRVLDLLAAEAGGVAVHLGGAKTRLTLAVLLTAEGRPVTMDQLIDRVWDEALPDGAKPRDLVQSCVSDLRGLLRRGEPGADELIPKRELGYRLCANPQNVDLHRFRALAKEIETTRDHAQVARLGREALREWGEDLRGREPLAGLDGRWAIGYRQRLRSEHYAVLVRFLDAETRLGHAPRLLAELEDLHRAAPLDERIVRSLMLAYHQAGDRPRALRLFERFRHRFDERHSAAPARETTELYRRIVEQDPALRPPPGTSNPGAAMPSPDIPGLAQRMTEILTPALPYLTGAEVPQAGLGGSWPTAKALWGALLRRAVMSQTAPGGPDPAALRGLLEDALARDEALATEAAAILTREAAPDAAAQINISGPYFHQGDNISGTSIKYYGGERP